MITSNFIQIKDRWTWRPYPFCGVHHVFTVRHKGDKWRLNWTVDGRQYAALQLAYRKDAFIFAAKCHDLACERGTLPPVKKFMQLLAERY